MFLVLAEYLTKTCDFLLNFILLTVVMGCDKNVRELNMIMISHFTICVNCELLEWQFSLFFVILSETLANFGVISQEIAEITGIEREQDFTF